MNQNFGDNQLLVPKYEFFQSPEDFSPSFEDSSPSSFDNSSPLQFLDSSPPQVQSFLFQELSCPLFVVPVITQLEDSAPQHSSSDEEKKQKKRIRQQRHPIPEGAAVSLTRDQLLTISSQQVEDYTREIKKARSLTPAEEKELKRQRRLVKNREYAQQSRNKKKVQERGLQGQIDILTLENSQLKNECSTLKTENLLLKQQISKMSATMANYQALPTSHKTQMSPLSKLDVKKSPVAGVCLFVVLSFAILFNVNTPPSSLSDSKSSGNTFRTGRFLHEYRAGETEVMEKEESWWSFLSVWNFDFWSYSQPTISELKNPIENPIENPIDSREEVKEEKGL